jgi:hypothetical protein
MAAKFSSNELAACAKREVGMRKGCYPRWDKVTLENLSPSRKKEIEMMEAIAEHFTPEPSVLDASQLDLLRDNADFCNARTRELLERLLADYDRLRNKE